MTAAEPVTFDSVSVGDRVRSPSWDGKVYEIISINAERMRIYTMLKCKNNMEIRESWSAGEFDARRFERVVLG